MRSPLFLAVSLAMAAAFQLSGPAAAAPADGPASAGPIALGDFMGRKRDITVNVAGQQGRFLLDTGGGVTVLDKAFAQRIGWDFVDADVHPHVGQFNFSVDLQPDYLSSIASNW